MYLHWGGDDEVGEVGKEKDPRILNESSDKVVRIWLMSKERTDRRGYPLNTNHHRDRRERVLQWLLHAQ